MPNLESGGFCCTQISRADRQVMIWTKNPFARACPSIPALKSLSAFDPSLQNNVKQADCLSTGFVIAVSRYLLRPHLQLSELQVLLGLFITPPQDIKERTGVCAQKPPTSRMHRADPLFLSLPAHTGLSGSMNFDEASENEADAEDGTRSLSPNTDGTRPASAASGKDVPVSSSASCQNKNMKSKVDRMCMPPVRNLSALERQLLATAPSWTWPTWRSLWCGQLPVASPSSAASPETRRAWTAGSTPLTSCTWRGRMASG